MKTTRKVRVTRKNPDDEIRRKVTAAKEELARIRQQIDSAQEEVCRLHDESRELQSRKSNVTRPLNVHKTELGSMDVEVYIASWDASSLRLVFRISGNVRETLRWAHNGDELRIELTLLFTPASSLAAPETNTDISIPHILRMLSSSAAIPMLVIVPYRQTVAAVADALFGRSPNKGNVLPMQHTSGEVTRLIPGIGHNMWMINLDEGGEHGGA